MLVLTALTVSARQQHEVEQAAVRESMTQSQGCVQSPAAGTGPRDVRRTPALMFIPNFSHFTSSVSALTASVLHE